MCLHPYLLQISNKDMRVATLSTRADSICVLLTVAATMKAHGLRHMTSGIRGVLSGGLHNHHT